MLAHKLRPPLFLACTPHGYHNTGTIRDELQAAGFVQVAIDTVEWRSWRPSPWHPAIGFCQGTPLHLKISRLVTRAGSARRPTLLLARLLHGSVMVRSRAECRPTSSSRYDERLSGYLRHKMRADDFERLRRTR